MNQLILPLDLEVKLQENDITFTILNTPFYPLCIPIHYSIKRRRILI